MATDENQTPELGPEIVGMRITVYHLLPFFLDPSATEDDICRLYGLTARQVAAARAYVLRNPEEVLARHLEIEARNAAGNPPEVNERMQRTHERFLRFKEWLANRDRQEVKEKQRGETPANGDRADSARLPSFREWLAEHEAQTEA